MSARILIIDSNNEAASALSQDATNAGHEVVATEDAASARARVGAFSPDVVVLSQQLPDATGLSLLEELRGQLLQSAFVLIAEQPEAHDGTEALRHGAFDVVPKGIESGTLLLRVQRAAEHALLRRLVAEAQAEWTGRIEFALLGDSPAMERLRTRMEALSREDHAPVLVTGESGVGKAVLARAVHFRSMRANEPFVVVDCASVVPTQLDVELFGHEPTSVAAAPSQAKVGRVETVHGGTLFLDEVTELDSSLQQKLLRLLEEREYTRGGGTTNRKFLGRVIAATSRDLAQAVEEGRFRADLKQRLEGMVLEVPSLRDRGEDVFLLADRYATQRARAHGRPRPILAADAREALATYPFPGNVRELCAMIDEALWLHREDTLTIEDFPVLLRYRAEREGVSAFGSSPPRSGLVSALPQSATAMRLTANAPPPSLGVIRERHADQERIKLVEALEQSGGNVSRAARTVGMSRYQMLRRLAKYGLR